MTRESTRRRRYEARCQIEKRTETVRMKARKKNKERRRAGQCFSACVNVRNCAVDGWKVYQGAVVSQGAGSRDHLAPPSTQAPSRSHHNFQRGPMVSASASSSSRLVSVRPFFASSRHPLVSSSSFFLIVSSAAVSWQVVVCGRRHRPAVVILTGQCRLVAFCRVVALSLGLRRGKRTKANHQERSGGARRGAWLGDSGGDKEEPPASLQRYLRG